MNIFFVGTGSALFSRNRFFSSLLISEDNHKLLIDTGDGIVEQLIRLHVDAKTIDYISFTHLHSDHFSGFTSLIAYMKLIKRTAPLTIIIHNTLKVFIEFLLNQVFLFPDRLGFQLIIRTFSDTEPFFSNEIFSIKYIANQHLSKYAEYQKEHSISINSFSILVQNKDAINTFYSGDVKNYLDLVEVYSKVKNLHPKYTIIETSHISIDDIKRFASLYNKSRLALTHIPDDIEPELNTWFNSLNISEKERIIISYDGLILENNL